MVQGFSNSLYFQALCDCVTSLLGYQTKQKAAARIGELKSTARVFETVTDIDIQTGLSKR